ncbi:MAG TPA: DUF3592 domain-containing protein, partial [Bdellovibrionales bacterium]|nr:DUF3592 domain-containing protein [Bdellovibrionales bacterium]
AGAIYVLGQIAYFFYSKHEKATLAIQKFRDVRDKSIFEPIMNQTQFESLRLLEPAQVRAAFVLKKRQTAVGAFVMIALGLGGVIGGERWYHSRTMFLGAAEKAKGRVAAWAESKGSDSTTYYYPLVRYRNPASNEDFTFKHGVGSSHPSWRIGDEVDVLYNPSAPEDAMIDQGRWWNQAGPVALMAFGILFLVLGFKNALYRDPGA